MMQTQIVRIVCHNDALVLESMAQNDIIRRREQARIRSGDCIHSATA